MSTRCHCGLLFQTINNCYAFIYISVDDSKDPSRITALRHEPAAFLGDGWVFRLVSSSLRCRSISSSYRTMVFSNSLSISSAAFVSLSPIKSLRDWTEDMAADINAIRQNWSERCKRLFVCPSPSCAFTFYRVARSSAQFSAPAEKLKFTELRF